MADKNPVIQTSGLFTELTSSDTLSIANFKLTTSPTNGFVLTSDASGVGTWVTTSEIRSFEIIGVKPTDEPSPIAGTLGSFETLDFDPDTAMEVQIQFNAPVELGTSQDVVVKARMAMSTSFSGDVIITTEGSVNNTTTITAADTTITPNATGGTFETQTLKTISSLTANDDVFLKIKRDAADGLDSHTGDWRLLNILIEYTT